MKAVLEHIGVSYTADLTKGIDLSLPVSENSKLNAYFAKPTKIEPVVMGNWVGDVKSGGGVNYRDVFFNPHGSGTHTECVGHIDAEIHSVNEHFKQFHMLAQLISIEPLKLENGDSVILAEQLPELLGVDGIIVRTLPNEEEKKSRNYSGANPPYLAQETIGALKESGCRHLVLDLPSVDREEDGGKLLGHRAFWNYPEAPRMASTITELAYIPNHVEDGLYLLNLQVAPFDNDAAPSRPVIFPLVKNGNSHL